MLEVFEEILKNYNILDKDIKLKYNHSKRVYNLASKYAQALNFSKRDIYIAEFIGLFHDIGRFNQLEKFHTYNDSISIDHGVYGATLLEDGILDKFDFTKKEQEIIKFSIKNHNKFEIEKCDDHDILKHAKLIRDIDKIDILTVYVENISMKVPDKNLGISETIMDSIKNFKQIPKYQEKNVNDAIACAFCYAFDINYKECMEEFMNNLTKYYEALPNKEIFANVFDIVREYIEKRK